MWGKSTIVSLLASAAVLPTTVAWGAVGHEIIATIAQIHLHPSTIAALCDILPEYANCHLGPIAAWADKVRMHMRWSASLHYVGGLGDHPSQRCVFGQEGWAGSPGHNVLSAIQNTTAWLANGYSGEEEALKFLVHFMGDLHQPLHLTNRDKGGNGDKVRFDGRVTNLHTVWDSRLLAKNLRTIPRNYTRPLPSRRIESALLGTIYDPYIRQIMYEGVLGRFKDVIPEWISCPAPAPARSQVPGDRSYLLSAEIPQLPLGAPRRRPTVDVPPTDDDTICPHAWAAPVHQLNCDIVWPPELDEPSYDLREPAHYMELDTPAYSGRIKDEWILEELLAMGGVRLAAILNYLYAGDGEAKTMDMF